MSAEQLSEKDLYGLQNEKFREILPHVFATPFYRRKLQSAQVGATDIHSLADLPSLPLTTKQELRASSPVERTPCSLDKAEYLFTSSGTSGTPTIHFWTRDDTQVLREAGARAMQRLGVRADDLALVLAPMGLPIMWYCMTQQYLAAGAGVVPLGVRPPDEVLAALSDLPVSIVVTLPVMATRLFEFRAGNQRQDHNSPRLRQFHCGGDFLSMTRRQRIERAWGVTCYNLYGMSEILGPLAGECAHKDGMHLLADYVYVEVLDAETQQPVAPGQPGVAVYTTLWNKGAPLLRYWSDDYVIFNPQPCACGRTSPRFYYLGRPLDLAVLEGRPLFASQLEEEILRFAVGSEYRLTLVDGPRAELMVESLPGSEAPVAALVDHLAALLGIPVEVQVLPPGALPRDAAKPQRIDDQRRTGGG